MPVIPQPIFATQHFYLTYDNDPLTKIVSVALDLTPSVPSTGWTLTGYLTQIRWQPAGQTAAVAAATTPNPVIVNVDRSVPGTILILGMVQDDNPDPTLNSSYNDHRPSQNGPTSNWGRGPYAGVGPIATQLAYIHVQCPNGHVKPAKFERDWAENPGSLFDLIDHVDEMWGLTSGLLSGDGYFDNIYEKTAGHEIHVHNTLDLQPGVGVRFTHTSPLSGALMTSNLLPQEVVSLVGTNGNFRFETTPFASTATLSLEFINDIIRVQRTGVATNPWVMEVPSVRLASLHAETLAGIEALGGPFRIATRLEVDELRGYSGTEVLLTSGNHLRKPAASVIWLGDGASSGFVSNFFSADMLPTIGGVDSVSSGLVAMVMNAVSGSATVFRLGPYTSPTLIAESIQTDTITPQLAANGVLVNDVRIWEGGVYQALGGTPSTPPHVNIRPPKLATHIGAPATATTGAWDTIEFFGTPNNTYINLSGVYLLEYEAMFSMDAGNNRQFRFILTDTAFSVNLTTGASAVINGVNTGSLKLILYINPTAAGFEVTGGFTVVANANVARAVDIPPFAWTAGARGLVLTFQANRGTGGTITKRAAIASHSRRVTLPSYV